MNTSKVSKVSDCVIILAAGMGTRMLKHNLVPKHLLPYKGKALLSHVIEAYKNNPTFYVVVQADDALTRDYVWAMHPERKIVFIDSENQRRGNPLYDVDTALDMLHKHSRLFITVADGVYTLPEFTYHKNWLGVAKVSVDAQLDYGNVLAGENGQFYSAVEKQRVPGSKAWVGLMYLETVNTAHNLLKVLLHDKPNASFCDWFNDLKVCFESFYVLDTPDWLDLGTASKYEEFLPRFDWSKPDQITYINDTRVAKFFKDSETAKQFSERAKVFPLRNLLPEVEYSGHIVTYVKVKGRPAYEAATRKQLIDLINRMQHQCWSHPDTAHRTDYTEIALWPLSKAQERRQLYLDQGTYKDYHHINGAAIDHNWWYQLEELAKSILLKTFTPSVIHGDLTLDNMLVQENGDICLLDWRPFTNAQDGLIGDRHYDVAKLILSCMIDLSALRKGHFAFNEVEGGVEVGIPWDSRLNLFAHSVYQQVIKTMKMDVIKLHAVLQLVSMAGVHKEPFASLFYTYAAYLANERD